MQHEKNLMDTLETITDKSSENSDTEGYIDKFNNVRAD